MALGKNRDIPISEFYTNLQLEWFSYFMRAKTYNRPEDIKKFTDICGKKKEKIDGISRKNCLPNIFENEQYKERYVSLFLGEWGLPQFQYRDDYQRRVRGMWDKRYYFNVGADVKVKGEHTVELGTITGNDHENCKLTVKLTISKEEITIHYDNVQRIFPAHFFENLNEF